MTTKLECGVCTTPIWHRVGGKLKRTPEYNEVIVNLSNLSKMSVGVCSKHTKPTKLELNMITEKTQQGWLEEVASGEGNEDWVRNCGVHLKAVSLVGG